MLRRLDPSTRKRRRPRPTSRLALAGGAAVGGAYLIGVWMVGLVLIVEAVFYVLVVWDDGKPASTSTRPEQVLDRWRQSR